MSHTVATILAERKAPRNPPRNDLERGLRKLRKIDRLLDRLVAAARPEDDPVGYDDWEMVFNAIFSHDPNDIKLRTHAALELTGFRFPSYCDPDTSYEADVRAWIDAFKKILARVEASVDED